MLVFVLLIMRLIFTSEFLLERYGNQQIIIIIVVVLIIIYNLLFSFITIIIMIHNNTFLHFSSNKQQKVSYSKFDISDLTNGEEAAMAIQRDPDTIGFLTLSAGFPQFGIYSPSS